MSEIIQIQKNNHGTTIICIDKRKADELLQYILSKDVIDEYLKIQQVLLENVPNNVLYQKVKTTSSVYEMRFTNKGKNDRIYYKVVRKSKKRYLILGELLLKKKSNQIPDKIMKKLKTLDRYNYET